MCAVSCSVLSSFLLNFHRFHFLPTAEICSDLGLTSTHSFCTFNIFAILFIRQDLRRWQRQPQKIQFHGDDNFPLSSNRKFNNENEWTESLIPFAKDFHLWGRKSFVRKQLKGKFRAENDAWAMPTNDNLVNGAEVVKCALKVFHRKLWFYCHRCRWSWNLFKTCQTYFRTLFCIVMLSCHQHTMKISFFKYCITFEQVSTYVHMWGRMRI